MVDGSTADHLARRIVERVQTVPEPIDPQNLNAIINDVRARFTPPGRNDFERSARRNALAGLRLSASERETIWALYQEVSAEVERKGLTTHWCVRNQALDLVRSGRHKDRYDAVIIDEAQDLTPAVLALPVEVCESPAGVYLTADASQSLYSRGFTWGRVSEQLQGRGRTALLKRNYRTSREITEAAAAFLRETGAGASAWRRIPPPCWCCDGEFFPAVFEEFSMAANPSFCSAWPGLLDRLLICKRHFGSEPIESGPARSKEPGDKTLMTPPPSPSNRRKMANVGEYGGESYLHGNGDTMPQEGLWLHWLDKMPPWFYTASAFGFLALLGVVVWWLGLGAKRLAEAMGRENRIISLQEKLNAQTAAAIESAAVADQLKAVLAATHSNVIKLNRLREHSANSAPGEVIRQILETLASDIKHRTGERHRCGLWIEADGTLLLTHASSGFPLDYPGDRRLTVNRSAAGQVFRLHQTRRWDDVRSQPEWEPNLDSTSPFKAMIGIPVYQQGEVIGVVTIDGGAPMTEQDQAIGELYTALIENAAYELVNGGIMELGQGG